MKKSRGPRMLTTKLSGGLMMPRLSAMTWIVAIVLLTQCATIRTAQAQVPAEFESSRVDSVGILLDVNSFLRHELDLLKADNDRLRTVMDANSEPWYIEAWRSEPVRWIIFVLGVWFGIMASNNSGG